MDPTGLFEHEVVRAIIAGAAGGLSRWLTLQEKLRAGLASVALGTVSAVYLSPLVDPIMSPFLRVVMTEDATRASFASFVVGLVGVGLTGFLIDIVRARRKKIEEDIAKDDKA